MVAPHGPTAERIHERIVEEGALMAAVEPTLRADSGIAVGTVGENPISGAILGSVVLKLVQRSSIPLLVVPTDEG